MRVRAGRAWSCSVRRLIRKLAMMTPRFEDPPAPSARGTRATIRRSFVFFVVRSPRNTRTTPENRAPGVARRDPAPAPRMGPVRITMTRVAIGTPAYRNGAAAASLPLFQAENDTRIVQTR
jgi:hypothetical protein